MIPSCSHTGTPLHFHSSTTSGSASLTKLRSLLSISPRQSPSSLILVSISCEGDWLSCDPLLFMLVSSPRSPGFDKWRSSPPECHRCRKWLSLHPDLSRYLLLFKSGFQSFKPLTVIPPPLAREGCSGVRFTMG